MELWAKVVIVIMYIGSAALPVWGLVGLYRTAVRDAETYAKAPVTGDGSAPTYGQFNVLVSFLHTATKNRPRAALLDFMVIGLGVGLGAGASIWALLATT